MEMEAGMGVGTLLEAFKMGGIWMSLILAPALLGNILAIVGLPFSFFAKKRIVFQVVGLLSLMTGLGILGLGFFGYTLEMMELKEAMPMVVPGHEADLQALGERYASYPLKFGVFGSILPLVASVLMLKQGLSRGELK